MKLAAGDEITVEFPDGQVRTFLRGYVRRRRPSALAAALAATAAASAANGDSDGGRGDVLPSEDLSLEGVPPPATDPAPRAQTAPGDD